MFVLIALFSWAFVLWIYALVLSCLSSFLSWPFPWIPWPLVLLWIYARTFLHVMFFLLLAFPLGFPACAFVLWFSSVQLVGMRTLLGHGINYLSFHKPSLICAEKAGRSRDLCLVANLARFTGSFDRDVSSSSRCQGSRPLFRNYTTTSTEHAETRGLKEALMSEQCRIREYNCCNKVGGLT